MMKKNEVTIHSSSAEYLTYVAARVLREAVCNSAPQEQGSCPQADAESQEDAQFQGLLIWNYDRWGNPLRVSPFFYPFTWLYPTFSIYRLRKVVFFYYFVYTEQKSSFIA